MKNNTKKIIVLIEKDYEEMELHVPRYRLLEDGHQVVVVGPKKGEVYLGKHGYPCKCELAIDEINFDQYHGVVIPGGWAPDRLRRVDGVLRLIKDFNKALKPIAFICHAGWVLASAKVLQKVHCTSTPAIKDDLIHAGAIWKDEPVVVDKHFVSSRRPEDLPFFCKEMLRLLN